MWLCLTVIVILISITMLGYAAVNIYESRNPKEEQTIDICRGYLTDKEYLQHMIPHHQVAIDISKMHQHISKLDTMQQVLRQLIWVQSYEIDIMREMLNALPENDMSEDRRKMDRAYAVTIGDLTNPNRVGLSDTYCDPHFFNPEGHKKHMEHMKLTDKTYIEHMIPHHQVAVDMSKRLLQHTKSDFMIQLAYRIIRSQQEEIVLLNDLLANSKSAFQSSIIN